MSTKFEVGDIITGLPESDKTYGITNSNAIMEVTKVVGNGTLIVKTLEQKEKEPYGRAFPHFTVNADLFELAHGEYTKEISKNYKI